MQRQTKVGFKNVKHVNFTCFYDPINMSAGPEKDQEEKSKRRDLLRRSITSGVAVSAVLICAVAGGRCRWPASYSKPLFENVCGTATQKRLSHRTAAQSGSCITFDHLSRLTQMTSIHSECSHYSEYSHISGWIMEQSKDDLPPNQYLYLKTPGAPQRRNVFGTAAQAGLCLTSLD